MMRKQFKLLDVPWVLSNKVISNHLVKVTMIIVVICIVIDLSLLKVYDLTPKSNLPRDKIFVFSCISAAFIITQIFILTYIKQQNMQLVGSRQYQIIHMLVTLLQWVLAFIVIQVIFQIWFESSFDIIPVIVGITISYSSGMLMTGFLSYRFFVWLRSKYQTTVLLYLLSSSFITTSALFTIVFLDSVSSLYTVVTPRIYGTGLYLSPFQGISLLLTNVLGVLSFIITWLATSLLLSFRSRYIGRTKYWVIIALPLIYFLSQFLSLFGGFAPFFSSDPVIFGMILTLIFTLSKLAGGILFGFAFWKMAKTIDEEFAVPRNLVRLAGYGYVILFMATQTVAFSIVPYPPFGFVTILYYGISSYMILVGVYYSVIVISQDSRLRTTIKKVTEKEPVLLAEISYAQLEDVIEKRAMRLVQKLSSESQSSLAIEQSDDENLKNYALSVIEEVRSYDPTYSRIMEKEREILSNSEVFSACIGGKLLEFIRDDQFAQFREVADKHRKGTHKGIRLITSIDYPIIEVVEDFLAIDVEVKHVPDFRYKQFVVSDIAVLEIPNLRNEIDRKLKSKYDITLVRYYNDAFENLWQSATDAKKVITQMKSNHTS
jgi:hypothetical protein